MRHRVHGRKLGRTKEHLLALKRNMAASLFLSEKGAVRTTKEKAREVQRFAEKLITLAKATQGPPTRYQVAAGLETEDPNAPARLKPRLTAFRRALAIMGNRHAVSRLFNDIAPRYRERPGGYTRIVPLAKRRVGDNASQCLLMLLGADEELTFHPKSKGARPSAAPVRVVDPAPEMPAPSGSEPAPDADTPTQSAP